MDVGNAGGRGGAGAGQLAVTMHDRLDPDGGEQHRSGEMSTQKLSGQVALTDVAHHPRNDVPATERGPVGLDGLLRAGAPGDVAVGAR